MKTIEKIKKNEENRKNLISRLLTVENVLSGSHNTVFRKCGKTNCWCNDAQKGHAYSRYIWRDKETGETKTKATGENDIEWMKTCTANYREVKKVVAELESLNNALISEVRKMIDQKIAKTEKKSKNTIITCKKSAK